MRLAALILVLLASACSESASPPNDVGPPYRISGGTMGTGWMVLVPRRHVEATDLAHLTDLIQSELDQVNDEMSHYQGDSELTRFNEANTTNWFPVAAGFADVVQLAKEVHDQSRGAFDVTIAPLIDLWGFGAPQDDERKKAVPTPDEIVAAQARCGTARLEVRHSSPAIKKTLADVQMNLSAIAKGHGVDRVGALLDGRGITDWFVEIGGEIRVKGRKLADTPWRVGVESPSALVRPGRRATERTLPLEDRAIATSGDYRNYWTADGIRYSHTLDPRTGAPVRHGCASVSVISDTCARADAWATALLVLGPDEGLKLAEARGIAAMFIVRSPGGGVAGKVTYASRATTTFPH
ncbi:MAG: FAD:protein FMN transferase ApbE [Planctomycetes bacterium]|nr:FAD:protein FMN transferase ApbE [Planctomycetota bacterium]